MEDKGPNDPVTPLMEGAVATYELFLSYREAGFNESQALQLVGMFLTAAYKENRDEYREHP